MELERRSLPLVEYAVRIEPRHEAETFEEGELLVRSFTLSESLDEPYELKIRLLADLGTVHVDPEALLEANLTLRMTRGDEERLVHGVVARVDYAGPEDDVVRLDLTVVPALSLLERWTRSRIFQEKSVVDIVTEIVRDNLSVYDREVDTSLLTRAHEVRDYCVQHRERDLEFVRRILAEEGIFVLFDHADERRERIVLVDDQATFVSIGLELLEDAGGGHDPSPVPVLTDRAELADTAGITGFVGHRAMATRSVVVSGWSWKPSAPSVMSATHDMDVDRPGWIGELHQHDERRLVEEDRGDGDQRDETPVLAERLLTAGSSRRASVRGCGLVTSFAAGHTFVLDGHPDEGLDGVAYLLRRVVHRADCPEVERGASQAAGKNYENTFVCAPLEVAQPPAMLPKPRIYGFQTAVVVGPPGEEIHVDRHGRIKVLMPWDREHREAAPDTSCWLRVAQMWAGATWGSFFVPRVGMEVLVSFIDGDPDRPIVTGCVYNGANPPPYPLPDEKTKSTIKTSSSPGGDGYNELRFEDAKGAEEIFVHGQRDMNTRVKRNQTNTVGHDQTITVRNDREVTVEGHEKHAVTKDRMRRVEGTEEVIIVGSQNVQIGGGPGAGSAVDPPVAGARTVVQGTCEIFARDKLVLQVGPSCSIVMTPTAIQIAAPTVIGMEVLNAALNLAPGVATTKAPVVSLQAQSSTLSLDVVAKLESDVQVRAQAGDSKLVCDPVMIRAQGANALLEGKGMTTISSSGLTAMSGATVNVSGDACVNTSSQGVISLSAGGITETIGGFINLG
jgi:type VI secretion system secreted protein VgrG